MTRRKQFGLKDEIKEEKQDKKRKRKNAAKDSGRKNKKKGRGKGGKGKGKGKKTGKGSGSRKGKSKNTKRAVNKNLRKLQRAKDSKKGIKAARKNAATPAAPAQPSPTLAEPVEAAGKAEAPLQPERASSSGGPIQRAKTKLYVSSPKSGAPKTKGRACAQKKKEVLEAVTRKAAGKSAKKKEAPPPELFDHYVACVTEACKDCVESECNHPDFDLTVPHDSFKISPYWTRGHVGVKASNDLLAESATKAKKKSGKNTESSKKVPKSRNVRQIANFSEPGCVYINYAMGQAFVFLMQIFFLHREKTKL